MSPSPHATTALVPLVVGDHAERDLNQAIFGWLAEYPTKTRTNYSSMLKQWLTFCRERGVLPLDAKREHVAAYARFLEHAGNNRVHGRRVSSNG